MNIANNTIAESFKPSIDRIFEQAQANILSAITLIDQAIKYGGESKTPAEIVKKELEKLHIWTELLIEIEVKSDLDEFLSSHAE